MSKIAGWSNAQIIFSAWLCWPEGLKPKVWLPNQSKPKCLFPVLNLFI